MAYSYGARRSDDNEVGVLLMGVTGHGKSATGNSILGRREFVSRGGGCSVTKDYHVGYTSINGRTVKVVDIPGFIDTDESTSEGQHQLVINALTKVLTKFPNGFHAVLLVVSYSNRLTEELQNSLRYILQNFDENAFRMHGILVLTYGDSFERDYGYGASVGRVVAQGYSRMLDTCGGRCILFDNITPDERKKSGQVYQLLEVIDSMRSGGARYIPSICRYNGGDQAAFERDRQRVVKMEMISGRIGLLKESMYHVNSLSGYRRRSRIEELKNDVYDIFELMENMNIIYPSLKETLTSFLTTLDMMAEGQRGPGGQEEILSGMQKDLDKKTEGNSFWKTVKKGLGFIGKIAAKALKFIFL